MATSGQVVINVEGLDELRSKLRQERADLPVSRFLDRAALHLQQHARDHANVDRGNLRKHIDMEKPSMRQRRVGTNVEYAADLEFGTKPHLPPPGELAGWARRHGMTESRIRGIIAERGTKEHPFLQPAADDTESYIETLIPTLASELESAFAE